MHGDQHVQQRIARSAHWQGDRVGGHAMPRKSDVPPPHMHSAKYLCIGTQIACTRTRSIAYFTSTLSSDIRVLAGQARRVYTRPRPREKVERSSCSALRPFVHLYWPPVLATFMSACFAGHLYWPLSCPLVLLVQTQDHLDKKHP